MMNDATPPSAAIAAAAVATNPAPYKDVRISACRVKQQHTWHLESNEPFKLLKNQTNHFASIWRKKDECSSESCTNSNGSRKRIVAGISQLHFFTKQRKRLPVAANSSDTDSMDGANAYQKDKSTPLQGNQLDDQSVVVKKLEPLPTALLDRTHDKVYDATTSVRAVVGSPRAFN
ncbi:hypothetical protein DAPPUDRAFT_252045 [Daphnia pulex]|uniref:Uncharacterized protein n=1 Tax=Daphnia pulex TaxID=6669 RepID=E9H1T8_DAPPU|nr:hypothetical protein DAPPUDRAFT_252045 [Daphnia pulex]|eukprot:EFX74230.1 hypothetical protein DAPPUDRAFT_252045 [Daphnia pulex]